MRILKALYTYPKNAPKTVMISVFHARPNQKTQRVEASLATSMQNYAVLTTHMQFTLLFRPEQ